MAASIAAGVVVGVGNTADAAGSLSGVESRLVARLAVILRSQAGSPGLIAFQGATSVAFSNLPNER